MGSDGSIDEQRRSMFSPGSMLSSEVSATSPGMMMHSCHSVDHFTVLFLGARQHSYTHVICCVETILCVTIR